MKAIIDHLKMIEAEMLSDTLEQAVDIDTLIKLGSRYAVHIAFCNAQMVKLKVYWSKAKEDAYKSFVFNLNDRSWTGCQLLSLRIILPVSAGNRNTIICWRSVAPELLVISSK
jgi:hypothetical protein